LTVAAGITLGAAGVLAVGRLIASLLFGLQPTDASTVAIATALLMSVAMVAGYLPVLAASRLDPASVLRE
jgi:ABC-type antimicrobial peptide transport system permease subunit